MEDTCPRCCSDGLIEISLRDPAGPQSPRTGSGKWCECACGFEWPSDEDEITDADKHNMLALRRRVIGLGSSLKLGGVIFDSHGNFIHVEILDDADPEREIAVWIKPYALELRLPTIGWSSPGTPIRSFELWRSFEIGAALDLDDEDLKKELHAAKRARKRQWATCQLCRERVPVEQRHDADTCQGCSETHLGIIH